MWADIKKKINRLLADMERVKWSINQRTDNNEIHYTKIKDEIRQHLSKTPIYAKLSENYFKKEEIIGVNKQIMIKNIAHSYFIVNCLKDKIKSAQTNHFDELEDTRAYLEKYIMDVVNKNIFITRGNQTALNNEITRLQYWLFYYKSFINSELLSEEDKLNLELIHTNIDHKLDKQKIDLIDSLFENLKKNKSSLKISFYERIEILKAMNLTKGHWFKCKQGHIYCITECGGAMEKGKCSECGNAIGGMNHKLDESNQLAKEFDGADHASFSDKASENQNIDYEDTFAV